VNENSQRRDEIVKLVREYQAKVTKWIKDKAWKTDDDDYEKSTEYQEALEYWNKFEEKDLVEYEVALAYARELFERYEKLDKSLDEKADSIVKYLGGGSALITVGALLSVKTDNSNSCLIGFVALVCMLPALVVALYAVAAAIRVRQPRASASFLSVKFAVDMAEYHKKKDKTQLNLWLMFHPICEAYHFRTFTKSELVKRAHDCYRWAINLLLLPVLGMAITLLVLTIIIPSPAPNPATVSPNVVAPTK